MEVIRFSHVGIQIPANETKRNDETTKQLRRIARHLIDSPTVVQWGQVCFLIPITKFSCWGPSLAFGRVTVTSTSHYWSFPSGSSHASSSLLLTMSMGIASFLALNSYVNYINKHFKLMEGSLLINCQKLKISEIKL